MILSQKMGPFLFRQEGPNDLTSAHHLASLLAEAFGKGPDRLRDELDAV